MTPSAYTPAPQRRFNVGDRVRVKAANPPGHRRTPAYSRQQWKSPSPGVSSAGSIIQGS